MKENNDQENKTDKQRGYIREEDPLVCKQKMMMRGRFRQRNHKGQFDSVSADAM